MKQRQFVRQGRRVAIAACGLLMGAWVLQSCKDDDLLLTGQPSWLGNSIYERLQDDGNYTTMLRLIDDLGQREVLAHTGSKTLFAANDSAFNEWFKNNNKWGVTSYDQLTLAQKKLLLNNSMVNNAYLVELLSNVSANPPKEGMCMRRETATSVFDSVEIVSPDQMPNTVFWKKYKDAGKSIRLLKDATTPPMIHLLPAFMKFNSMTSKDMEVISNGQSNSTTAALVNGREIVDRDITCKNGYIQKVNGVIESSPNMAEIIRTNEKTQMWSSLLDRFCAPYYNDAATKEFDRLYNSEDSVYVLRYFSSRSAGGTALSVDPDGKTDNVRALLKFDPGWNQYMYDNTMNYDLHYDCGVMIVPTDEALEYWWNHGGRDLQDNYKEWDSIPDATIAKLINVNMLERFTSAFPSKFDLVLDDAMEQLGITPDDVETCYMGCNGLIYMTNKVFTPTEFSSVVYPALAHEKTMNIPYWMYSGGELSYSTEGQATSSNNYPNYLPYLLSMDSYYSLILPSNEGMLWYVDPTSYGRVKDGMDAPSVLQFYYDKKKPIGERVQAYRYDATVDEDGNITLGVRTNTSTQSAVICDRLKRLANDLIIVGNIEDGHEYYKAKSGALVRVTNDNGQWCFEGGWQMEKNHKRLYVNNGEIFTKVNGKSYQLNDQMPLPAQNSVYLTMKNNEEFSEFYDLFTDEAANLMSSTMHGSEAAMSKTQGNKNITLMDNYNYNIYIPTNESLRQFIDDGYLPTWEDYRMLGVKAESGDDEETIQYSEQYAQLCEELAIPDTLRFKSSFVNAAKDLVKNIIVNFLRYHIQDCSVAVNMAPEIYDDVEQADGTTKHVPVYVNDYESMTRNPKNGRFFPIKVDFSNKEQMTVTDATGQEHHVVKDNGLYNIVCREYWIKGASSPATAIVYSTSDAVVHQIDSPLQTPLVSNTSKPWRQQIKEMIGRE